MVRLYFYFPYCLYFYRVVGLGSAGYVSTQRQRVSYLPPVWATLASSGVLSLKLRTTVGAFNSLNLLLHYGVVVVGVSFG